MATINGVRLRFEREGVGDRVVLVHGSWGDHQSWRSVVPLLAGDHEVVTYDRRGHSDSEAPPGQGSIDEDVGDVAGLIEHLGPEPVHLVGNSAGGAIVLRAAIRHPRLLRSVTANEPDLFGLLGADQPASVRADREGHAAEIRPVLELIAAGSHEEAARLFMETVTFGPGAWDTMPPTVRRRWVVNAPTFLDQHRDPDWETIDVGDLAAAAVPLQLIYGDQTRPAFKAVAEVLAGQVGGATVTVLAGCGHGSTATHPEAFADALRAFWSRLGAGGRA